MLTTSLYRTAHSVSSSYPTAIILLKRLQERRILFKELDMSNENQKSSCGTAAPATSCTSEVKTDSSCSTTPMKAEGACTAGATPSKAEKLGAEIKKAWNKLTDDDVKLLETNTAQFFANIKEKHNLTQDEAQKRLDEIKASCGTCSAEKAA